MNKKTHEQKDRDWHRYDYWWKKVTENTPLIPEKYVTTEQELRDLYREYMASKGQPVIPDDDLKPITQQDTSVGEFYKIKAEWEKGEDDRWRRGLSGNDLGRDIKTPSSYQKRVIERGISPLLFGKMSPKAKEYTIHGEDITNKHRKQKKKLTWNF